MRETIINVLIPKLRNPTSIGVDAGGQGTVPQNMDLRTLTRACRGFFIGAITQGQKAESGGGVLGEVEQPSAIQLGLWGSAVSSPSGVGGGSPTAQGFSHYFQHS